MAFTRKSLELIVLGKIQNIFVSVSGSAVKAINPVITIVSKMCLWPFHTSVMEHFAKIADCQKLLSIFSKNTIVDIWQGLKYASETIVVKAVNYFVKTFHHHSQTVSGPLDFNCQVQIHCTKKWSFLLRMSWVNVPKSAVSSGLGQTFWRNP